MWHEERQQAKVTGSTIFKAFGLNTLKEQQEHYNDKVKGVGLNGKEMTISSKTEEAMKYGTENELNAVGTSSQNYTYTSTVCNFE